LVGGSSYVTDPVSFFEGLGIRREDVRREAGSYVVPVGGRRIGVARVREAGFILENVLVRDVHSGLGAVLGFDLAWEQQRRTAVVTLRGEAPPSAPSLVPTPAPTPAPSPAFLTESQKVFFSVIAAEAGAQGRLAWQCVANVIQNRYFNKRDGWRNATSVRDIVANRQQFNGYQDQNYHASMRYLDNRDGSHRIYEGIIEVTTPYYELRGDDILNGAVLFYSPRSMSPPFSVPRWVNEQVEEVIVEGINRDEFRFYRYR